ACSVIPLLCERYLTVRDAEHAAPPPGTVPTALDRLAHAIDALAAWYARSLAAVLHHPQRVALVAVGLVVAGYVAYRAADTGFLQILSDVVNDLAGNARPVEIKLFGPDLAALKAYGTRLDSAMAGIEGLEDLFSGVSEPTAEMAMRIDAAEANHVGLTPAAVT